MSANDRGCVKTLRGITAPGILASMVMRRAENAKICLPLGIATKSDFVFAQPRPSTAIGRIEMPHCTKLLLLTNLLCSDLGLGVADAILSIETTRVHRHARRLGDVAVGGARTTARACATYRRAHAARGR